MIQVLHRAFSMLEQLEGGELSLAELARETAIQKTTAANILKTLTDLGAVSKTTGGRYSLGPRLLELAEPQLRQQTLQPLAQRTAERLAQEVGETVVVSALKGVWRYVIAVRQGTQELTVRIELMEERSPYDATTGRVLLAFQPEAVQQRIRQAHGLPGPEWRQVDTAEELEAALEEIRRTGMAFDVNATQQIQTLAAPVFGPDGQVWAAIGIRMPHSRFQDANRETVISALRASARHMGDLLGYGARPTPLPVTA